MAKRGKAPRTIDPNQIKVRRTWGRVKPGTKVFKDRKKQADKRACRGRQALPL